MHRFIAVLAFTIGAFGLMAPNAHAAGKGHHNTDPAPASCSVSPNPANVGGLVTVSGSGLPTDVYLNVVVSDANGQSAVPVGYSTDGTTVAEVRVWAAGTDTAEVRSYDGSTITVYASCTFDVV